MIKRRINKKSSIYSKSPLAFKQYLAFLLIYFGLLQKRISIFNRLFEIQANIQGFDGMS